MADPKPKDRLKIWPGVTAAQICAALRSYAMSEKMAGLAVGYQDCLGACPSRTYLLVSQSCFAWFAIFFSNHAFC